YREYLAPGAVIAIDRADDNDGQFTIQYTQAAQREERVLQIDERRNRYVFRPQAIVTQVDDPWLLSETRYPRLANAKPLDDRARGGEGGRAGGEEGQARPRRGGRGRGRARPGGGRGGVGGGRHSARRGERYLEQFTRGCFPPTPGLICPPVARDGGRRRLLRS